MKKAGGLLFWDKRPGTEVKHIAMITRLADFTHSYAKIVFAAFGQLSSNVPIPLRVPCSAFFQQLYIPGAHCAEHRDVLDQ